MQTLVYLLPLIFIQVSDTNYGLGSVKVKAKVLDRGIPYVCVVDTFIRMLSFYVCVVCCITACHFPQAELNLHKLTRSSYWKYEQVRLNFWQSCDTTFQRESVEPEQAAQFFEVSEFCILLWISSLAHPVHTLSGKTPLIIISRL